MSAIPIAVLICMYVATFLAMQISPRWRRTASEIPMTADETASETARPLRSSGVEDVGSEPNTDATTRAEVPNETTDDRDWFIEKSGRRLGPLKRADLAKLNSNGEIDRRTMVWTEAFKDGWKPLEDTDLINLSPELTQPPPLPLAAIRNEWAYLLATFPAWGTVLLVMLLAGLVQSPLYVPPSLQDLGLTWAPDVLQLAIAYRLHFVSLNVNYLMSFWWLPLAFFVAGNALLSLIDEQKTSAAGIKTPGGLALAAFLVPVYLFVRARAIQRVHPSAGWSIYLPFCLWIVCMVIGVFIQDPLVANL